MVFADKGVKAIVARWGAVSAKSNNPADLDNIKIVARLHSKEISELDPKQNEMAKFGTTHLVPIMNDFNLLPTHNFKYGQHINVDLIGSTAYRICLIPVLTAVRKAVRLPAHTA